VGDGRLTTARLTCQADDLADVNGEGDTIHCFDWPALRQVYDPQIVKLKERLIG
jgi:hypothetical protein